MYFIVSSVVLLYIYFAIESTTATENGYIVAELPEIPCKDPSSAIPACSGSLGYNIPDFKNYPNFPDLSKTREKTVARAKLLFGILGNQKCSKAGMKYVCERMYPFRCRDTNVEADGKELEATCNEGRNDCSGLKATLRDSIFKCSGIANDPTWKKKIPRKLTCVDFPVLNNDPYSCEANYKVFNFGNATMLKVAADKIAFVHKILKSSNVSDAECEQNAADVVCNLIPACSKDRSKVVSLHSRQDCRKIVGCLNKTNNANLIQGANDLCKAFPDGKTAKKYSLENVYDNKAASHAMASTMILCVAILVAQCFF